MYVIPSTVVGAVGVRSAAGTVCQSRCTREGTAARLVAEAVLLARKVGQSVGA